MGCGLRHQLYSAGVILLVQIAVVLCTSGY